MTTFYWIVSAVLVLVLLAITAQEIRYLRVRRNAVADRQELLHSSSAFHVVTVLALSVGQDLLDGVRGFNRASEGAGGKLVYAGKIAVNAIASAQIPRAEWDAFVLVEYPSREAYEIAASNPELQKARAGFATSYAMGMQRSPWANLAIPIGLMGMRAVDIIKRSPNQLPFGPPQPTDGASPEMLEQRDRIIGGLLANREYGNDALVVLNFLKSGSKEQRQANADYSRTMMGMMAEAGCGPMHMGKAVTLEGDAQFDAVAIVYYPGVEFFASMAQSPFFGRIAGDKQLGDTLAAPSVPLLPHL